MMNDRSPSASPPPTQSRNFHPESESDSIPLADDDPAAILEDEHSPRLPHLNAHEVRASRLWKRLHDGCESMDSIPSMVSEEGLHGASTPRANAGAAGGLLAPPGAPAGGPPSCLISEQMHRQLSLDPDFSPDEVEEKARLIAQVLELQNTLDDLTQRVDAVKEENLKLRSENSVLGQYIDNLMQASAVFQAVTAAEDSAAAAAASGSKPPRVTTSPGTPGVSGLGSVIRCTARVRAAAVGGSSSSSTPSPSSVSTASSSGSKRAANSLV